MEEKRGRGRPRAKKSNPDYTTLSVYVRKSTLKLIKKRCIDEEMEVSELVQQLFEAWLNSDIQKSETLD